MEELIPMLPEAAEIVYALDMMGVFACTVAATVLAKRLKFDFFGALLVSFLGSVGGGTLRDILLNRHPIFWLYDLNYLYLIIGVSVLVQIFYHEIERFDRVMRWFDALGLAAFTVIGVEAALTRAMSAPIVILMGVFTAMIGGVLRDIVCREIPLVLQKEIYITASVAGSVYYLIMRDSGINLWLLDVSSMLLIVSVRMLAVYRGWNLPDITWQRRGAKPK